MVIFPYHHQGTWMFDDERVELVQEPFVEGMPEIIDLFVQNIPNRQAKLVWDREEDEGNWYRWDEQGLEGWLCPALFKYFSKAPSEIYCKAEVVER